MFIISLKNIKKKTSELSDAFFFYLGVGSEVGHGALGQESVAFCFPHILK
jgi:hypothetical protein